MQMNENRTGMEWEMNYRKTLEKNKKNKRNLKQTENRMK